MKKPHIVLLDDYERVARSYMQWASIEANASVDIHTSRLTGDALLQALKPAEVIVLIRDRTPLQTDLIAQLPNLKMVLFTGTRNNTLDTSALTARKIPVCHTAWGPSKDSTTEITWALILAAQKQLEAHMNGLRKGVWRPRDALLPTLNGKTLGLVGLGEIGGRVAKIAKAFGMNVIAWSPNLTPERAAEKGAIAVTRDALIAQSDIISLHIVLSEKTKNMFDAAQFAAMKPGAIFVNTSRAGLANEAELIEGLKRNSPAMAALDVFQDEPISPAHPLLKLENVVLTPHLGFVCEPVFRQFYKDIAECLTAYVAGEKLMRVLNAEDLAK